MSTTPLNQTLIAKTATDIIYGTCEVDGTFGTVISSSVKLATDEQAFEDCRGNTEMVLLRNITYTADIEAYWDTGDYPSIGDAITFPDVGMTGNVTGADGKRAQADRRKISITAKVWLSMGSDPTVTQLSTGS